MMGHEKCEEIKMQGRLGFKALKEHAARISQKSLFPETDSAVFLSVKYKKIPFVRGSSLRKFISLPCSDRSPSNTSICLILPDLDRSNTAAKDPDVDEQARRWAELLREKYGLTREHIAKIFTITQLKREYGMQSDKAKLANAYDIFMVDKKLMRIALNFLGGSFKKTTKMPLPINSSVDMSKKLKEAFSLVQLHFTPLKDTVTVRIGNLGQSLAELTSNFDVIVDAVSAHLPGGMMNVRSCHLQTSATAVSLPIFVDFDPPNEILLEKSKKRQFAVELGECSTLPEGLMVKVRADGKVTVVQGTTGEEVLFPTEQDEWEKEDDIRRLDDEALQKELHKKANRMTRRQRKGQTVGRNERGQEPNEEVPKDGGSVGKESAKGTIREEKPKRKRGRNGEAKDQ